MPSVEDQFESDARRCLLRAAQSTDAALNQVHVDTVTHYTGTDIFEKLTNADPATSGILHRPFRATACRYCNDEAEFAEGVAVMTLVANNMTVAITDDFRDALKDVLGQMDREISNLWYVICFSARNDDLGQWRGYGRNGKGLALSYNRTELELISDTLSGWVVYERNDQERFAKNYILTLASYWPSLATVPTKLDLLKKWISAFTLLIKKEAWEVEEEFRVIAMEDDGAVSQRIPKFFERHGRLVPYLDMPPVGFSSNPIVSLKIGPLIRSDSTLLAIRKLNSVRGLTIAVENSDLSLQE